MYTSKLEIKNRINELLNKNRFNKFFLVDRKLRKKLERENKLYILEKKKEYKDLLDNVNGHALDDYQREIVLSEEDSSLVIAGAGSGKSLTLLGRILYLVHCGVNPKDILCISFTNKACDSLRKKLRDNGVNMDVYTFHKLGMKILKSNGVSRKIVDENVLGDIITEIINKKDLLDILPDYDFKDYGDGDFSFLHHHIVLETKYIYNLKMLFMTFINLFKGNNYTIDNFDNFFVSNENEDNRFVRYRNNKLLCIAKEIYEKYCYYLDKNECIDFHDMINLSIDVINKVGIYNYKYIIIDEYQDISVVKCELVKLIKEKTGASLLAVGDDFQSIYRFTGSNLDVFLNFESDFPCTKVFKLNKTYRNSSELLDIMGRFILKNKRQISKYLLSNKRNFEPIYIYYYDKSVNEVLDNVIEYIDDDFLIIGRNNKDIRELSKSYRCLTVHKSKGLEAENVVIVNLEDGMMGFPNKLRNDDILKYVTDNCDIFPYEEERRLFYVAMTRTQNCNYLLVNKNKPSEFVTELLKENKNIKIMNDILYCPKCHGTLIKRKGRYGEFYGCSNFPNCRFTCKIN